MRPLFGPRTVVEAAFLVAVPIVALEAGVSWYAIVAMGAVAYFLVLIVEAVLWRQAKRALPPPPPEPLKEEVVARPPERIRAVRIEPEVAPAPEPAATGPRQWNVRDLEQLAQDHSGADPVADEERTFLLRYLRDFAGPDGLLPVDFDDVVRRSFGGLVAE